MESLVSLVVYSIQQVWLSLQHNWPFLVLSVFIATALKLFIDTEKVSAFLNCLNRCWGCGAHRRSITARDLGKTDRSAPARLKIDELEAGQALHEVRREAQGAVRRVAAIRGKGSCRRCKAAERRCHGSHR
jgi:hypothetical protein